MAVTFTITSKIQQFCKILLIIASERSPLDLSETILNSLAPCEGIVKFRHTLLVYININIVLVYFYWWYLGGSSYLELIGFY